MLVATLSHGDGAAGQDSAEPNRQEPAYRVDTAGSEAGSLTYHVSAPLKADGTPLQGVRIVSHGKPSNVTVKAVLYTDDTYSTTTTVELGVDNKVLKEFSFGKLKNNGRALAEYTAVKDLVFEWAEGTTPQISRSTCWVRFPAWIPTSSPSYRRRSMPRASRTRAPGPPTPSMR